MSATTRTIPAPAVGRDAVVTTPRSWKATILFAALTVVALLGFALFTSGAEHSRFNFSATGKGQLFYIPEITVPSKAVCLTTALICLAITAAAIAMTVRRIKVPLWLSIIFMVSFVFSFLTWAGSTVTGTFQISDLARLSLFLGVPLVFGALAGVIGERSGTINVAIEGQLLGGAFFAAFTGSIVAAAAGPNNAWLGAWIGLALSPLAGMFVAWLLEFFTIRYQVDQIIVGVVLNMLMSGLTGYLFGTFMRNNPQTFNVPLTLPVWRIPILADIPILGPALFQQTPIVYIMYVVVILLQIMVFGSRWGLRMRSTGEHPMAADTVGIDVNRTRRRNVLLAGAIAGFGGAFFTVGQGVVFNKDMTSGKGYIALAAMIFGRWSPRGALGAALLFSFADALQTQLTSMGSGIPSDLMLMLPYLLTIFVIAGLAGRVRPPAMEGVPYVKQ